jgi:hypothetical protein
MKVILSGLFLFSLSFGAMAADGSSGCGPGWYIAKDNSLLSSSIRSTTNAILGVSVTFGMTFGTSNCQKHSIVKNEMEDLKFATENYFEIAADSSKGEGQFLAAYAELMGCKGESINSFKTQMKNNFKELFNQDSINPEKLVKETYMLILRDENLVKSCFAV